MTQKEAFSYPKTKPTMSGWYYVSCLYNWYQAEPTGRRHFDVAGTFLFFFDPARGWLNGARRPVSGVYSWFTFVPLRWKPLWG